MALVAYLFGSVPTGFLVAKARGVDIRTVGSGNIGATNAFRVLGKGFGIFVLLMDALKGWVAVEVAALVVYLLLPGAPLEYLRITAAIAAILGHNFTCWLNFKGGKGIATSAGVLIALVPLALVIILSIFIILFLATRYVSVGSIAAAFALPFATWFTQHDVGLTAVMAAIGALAILKHRKNIQRLLNGTENRIQFRKKEATP
ncbi:MAG TPA: glycerol-3-phosphate 1-O-acyltransferase PlsY [Verrucomicrobiae bacterium]|jgi:glycerol-3-phosphate acyltransferase PlsY|nr:glycerol-3-phosphate 1-O-acyltransferase PlsY [Verrucomicrobiae bacterium]